MPSSYTKDPQETWDYHIDWAGMLTPGDTVTASVWEVPAGLTVESDTFDGTSTTIVLSGGSNGGNYVVQNTVTTDQGSVGERSFLLMVREEVPPPPLPEFCWPVDTSCVEDWDSVTEDPDSEDPDAVIPRYSAADKARAVAFATQSLRMLTAYRVGGCPITVRPAARRCRELTWQTYPVAGGGSTPWRPVDLGGTWLNVGCDHLTACGCGALEQIDLGQASSVTEVKVDGVVLDPSAYRLDPGGRLVRLDGEAWPLCQNLAAPDTEEGTYSVTYVRGAAVDGLGAVAAGILAGEFVRACTGGECRLPDNIVRLVRNGVEMTLGPGAFPDDRTGIREVDAYLDRWNPHRHKVAPMVWSPDLARHRRVTGA